MARVILILMGLAICVAIAAVLYAIWTNVVTAGNRALASLGGNSKEGQMGPKSIKKAAYIALIVVLFGTATGSLGGM
ncbi:MAG: hypothetical protein ABJL67_15050 [Sulfitobacter sp.]